MWSERGWRPFHVPLLCTLNVNRVLNTFKSMIVDNDILEDEDSFIFERMKEFISNEEVQSFAAAKQLGIHIERAVSVVPLWCLE
jgi:hypothetical protein